MTIVLDRPVTATAPVLPVCPPWCDQDPDWHDDEQGRHDSPFTIVSTGDTGCTRHGDPLDRYADEVWLALERDDDAGRAGEPRLYLAPTADRPMLADAEAHMTLDQAEALAHEILRLVAVARAADRGVSR